MQIKIKLYSMRLYYHLFGDRLNPIEFSLRAWARPHSIVWNLFAKRQQNNVWRYVLWKYFERKETAEGGKTNFAQRYSPPIILPATKSIARMSYSDDCSVCASTEQV